MDTSTVRATGSVEEASSETLRNPLSQCRLVAWFPSSTRPPSPGPQSTHDKGVEDKAFVFGNFSWRRGASATGAQIEANYVDLEELQIGTLTSTSRSTSGVRS